jgi:hypothetical protein
MKMKNISLIGAAIIPLLAGCASTPVALDSIGPAPAKPSGEYVPTGWLRVYTATDAHEIGDNTYYYTHTGYRIYSEDGRLWKYIPNHTGDMDESVANVQIPEGNYRISAQSEAYNFVSVPVIIRADKTTDIHLETTWKAPAGTPTNELVYLPDGYPVGWKSSMTK